MVYNAQAETTKAKTSPSQRCLVIINMPVHWYQIKGGQALRQDYKSDQVYIQTQLQQYNEYSHGKGHKEIGKAACSSISTISCKQSDLNQLFSRCPTEKYSPEAYAKAPRPCTKRNRPPHGEPCQLRIIQKWCRQNASEQIKETSGSCWNIRVNENIIVFSWLVWFDGATWGKYIPVLHPFECVCTPRNHSSRTLQFQSSNHTKASRFSISHGHPRSWSDQIVFKDLCMLQDWHLSCHAVCTHLWNVLKYEICFCIWNSEGWSFLRRHGPS